MRLTYYGDVLSPNITRTPEGYLVCKNVPIGRTGHMEYLADELELKDVAPDQAVDVYRTDDEVFAIETLASFEGKPVTNNHPPDDVAPGNWTYYTKGHVQNVRRGNGCDTDKIMADLFITDPLLIAEVENNLKRQVSSGYACIYTPGDNGCFYQRQIRGNHVAVVDAGRAGDSVCIHDSMPKAAPNIQSQPGERRKLLMSKNAKNIRGILSLFVRGVRDAKTTDEIEDMTENAAAAIDNAVSGEAATGEKVAVDDQPFEGAGELLAAIKGLTTAVAALDNKGTTGDSVPDEGRGGTGNTAAINALRELLATKKETGNADGAVEPVASTKMGTDEDPIADIIRELTGNDNDPDDSTTDEDTIEQEEALTVNAETMDTDNSVLTSEVRDAAIAIFKNARPAIAQIKNMVERKRVTDALLKSVRGYIGGTKSNGVAGIMNVTATSAQKRAVDSASQSGAFDLEARQAAYDKHNPHINKEVK